jgi:hypothetical protein
MIDKLITMAYASITDYNVSQGLEVPICYVNNVTGGLFIPLFLMAVWIIFLLGSYFIQKEKIGSGDFPMSLAVAGFVTSILAILLRLVNYNGVPCLVDGLTLAVTIIVAGISILYFLFSKD